jgi:hypothetical protein
MRRGLAAWQARVAARHILSDAGYLTPMACMLATLVMRPIHNYMEEIK